MRLSRKEKRVLRALHESGFQSIDKNDLAAVCSLDWKGLVKAVYEEGGTPVDALLTCSGKSYLAGGCSNRLREWFDTEREWSIVVLVVNLITLACLVALFVKLHL